MTANGAVVLGCGTAIRYNTAVNVTGFRFAPSSTLAVRYAMRWGVEVVRNISFILLSALPGSLLFHSNFGFRG